LGTQCEVVAVDDPDLMAGGAIGARTDEEAKTGLHGRPHPPVVGPSGVVVRDRVEVRLVSDEEHGDMSEDVLGLLREDLRHRRCHPRSGARSS
jgi:hypothetical protein